ncbi:MAG: alpha/beta fold hydrolase [Promethearchaeota archaeon]|nr:MAG: alpha/beta fold hydrolase [Candidatus Lokiarchaeota archaeon]
MRNMIFIHGLESSGEGFKGNLFRKVLPGILTPNFKPYAPEISYKVLLKERMTELFNILKKKKNWTIIGSSFGGLMGTLYSVQYPKKVKHLILLAPFLSTPLLDLREFEPVDVRVTVFHGKNDQVVPYKSSMEYAKTLFKNLKYNIVDDDHMLHSTVKSINWVKLIENS